ncbi:MAG: murein biosynthesis integral membrane protein MurJ [Anaerolineae bacterium]|nr:murein biosynthesis integral membrane protein MurJ [Anaerolineae bacterium]
MTIDPVLEPAVTAPEVAIAEAERAANESTEAGLARATTILALGNIASRLLGFAKEILLSNYFGAGRAVDAFQIAITVPQDLYDLAISGHVNSAIVPVLSEYAVKDKRELWRLVSALLGLVTLATSALVLILELFAPQIVTLWRGTDISAEAFNLSVHLLRLTAPALIFLSLFAIVSGMLYALKRFTWPAFAAALFNGTIVVTMVILAPVIGIERAAVGWVLGAILQLALQFGGLRGAHIRLQVRGALQTPGVRRIGILYVPVMISLIMDVLINRPFSYNLASQAGDGSIAYMNWATSLREFPMGLVGTAISIAILPTLARHALKPELRQNFKDTLGQGIRLALVLIIPATVGMFVLAGPLIGLVFERGAFTATDTTVMALVLRLYLLGIPFAAVDLLLIFAFYAVKDTMTPALVGILSLGCYIVVALLLYPSYGLFALMIADSLKHLIHMVVSIILLRRRLGGLGSQRLPGTLLKVTLATAVMALVTYAVARSAVELWPVQGLTQRALLVFVPATLGGAMYFVLASLLRLNEFTWFVQALGRKIR